jgi:preprotein translocase SecE subunit
MAQAESKNVVVRSANFFQESVAELKKVHTPTRQETIMLTTRVFFLLCLFGVFLGLTDLIVGSVMQYVLTDQSTALN